jgi:tRNA threonylcarbamoyladenosine biosynthesis protein TsaB
MLTLPELSHLLGVFGDENIESLLGQIAPQQVAQARIVVDDKNFASRVGVLRVHGGKCNSGWNGRLALIHKILHIARNGLNPPEAWEEAENGVGNSVQFTPMVLNLLALETSSSRCGVALLRDDGARIDVRTLEHEGREEHAERLLPMATELLEQAGLAPHSIAAVAFGQGPGGFTGLRVACGVAQGMALALNIPVIGVVSHHAAAQQVVARPDQAIVVALDARMGEVYLAVYRRLDGAHEDTRWQVLQEPLLMAATEVVAWIEHYVEQWSRTAQTQLTPVLAGDAWLTYSGQMFPQAHWSRVDVLRPDSPAVARLARQAWYRGETIDPELAAPLYVRDKVAFTTEERLRGQGGNPKAASALATSNAVHAAPQPMLRGDLDAVATLEREVQSFPWTRGNFADALDADYGAWVLRENDRITGFCILMHAPDVAHLLVIAVDKRLHRGGRGGRLVKWCEARARERGIPGLLLEVRPSNASAIAFYEQHGFVRVGLRRNYYPAGGGSREDALVMRKDLNLDEAA